jgi:hypothetical protein
MRYGAGSARRVRAARIATTAMPTVPQASDRTRLSYSHEDPLHPDVVTQSDDSARVSYVPHDQTPLLRSKRRVDSGDGLIERLVAQPKRLVMDRHEQQRAGRIGHRDGLLGRAVVG